MFVPKSGISAAVCVALSFAVSPVSAASVSTGDLLNYFNSVTLGDTSTQHDIEGRTYVGGNLVANGSLNIKNSPSESPYASVVVAGTLNSTGSINVNNGGNVVVGGDFNGNWLNLNGGTAYLGGSKNGNSNQVISQHQDGANFTARFPTSIKETVVETSKSLAKLASTGSASNDKNGQKLQFNADTGADKVTVYNIDWSLLSTRPELELALNGAGTVIVNVLGNGANNDGFAINNNFIGGSSAISTKTLWNFVDATTINFNKQFYGAILAPNAHITNSTPIEGSVIAGSANYGGEVHVYGWNGSLPLADVSPSLPAVPVPATLPLIASAFAVLAFMRRRGKTSSVTKTHQVA